MTTLTVSIERRFDRSPDGKIWVPEVETYSFWQRYLEVFEDVRVVARVRDVAQPPAGAHRSDGERVSFAALPHYIGPWQYLLRAGKVKRAAQAAVGPEDAVLLRVDSQIAACIQPALEKSGRPYGVEVVADPYDCFAPGTFDHPLRPYFRWKFTRELRKQCAGAAAAAYVTEGALQRRYPPPPTALATHYSSVDLPDDAVVDQPRGAPAPGRPHELLAVGSMDNLIKAQDVTIEAVASAVRDGLDVRLTFVGDGRFRKSLEQRAAELNLNDRIRFAGRVSPDRIRESFDRSDLFVLPSRGEALSRALLEGMARALPAVASTVGGFPEVLAAEDLVPPGDPAALAAKLAEILRSPQRLASMSARNLEKSREYRSSVLSARRRTFYQYLKDRTQQWVRDRKGPA